jgi:transportin-3
MLHIIHSFGEELPAACQNSCQEAWAIFDSFLVKYGSSYDIAERTTRVLRHGITLFGDASLPVAASVVARMSLGFEATGFPSYLWIAGKIIGSVKKENNQALQGAFREVYERSTNKVVSLLQTKPPGDVPDGTSAMFDFGSTEFSFVEFIVLEDFLQMLLQLVEFAPDIYFQSSAFPLAFRAAMAALTVVHSDIIFASLDLIRITLTHDSIANPPTRPPSMPVFASAIRGVFEKEGFELVGYLLSGLVGDFPEDSTSAVVSIFRVISSVWTSQLLSWLPLVLQQLPTTASNQVKTQFLSDVTRFVDLCSPPS